MTSRYIQREGKTLCGLTTVRGRSGLAVVRVSGKKALEISLKVCPSLSGRALESHRAYKCDFVRSGLCLDSGLVLYFEEGRSFTGEETVEFFSHGSPIIVEQLLQVLIDFGASLALPGEFSFRAFINGKLDLVQAESIHQLVESRSELVNRFVLGSLKGENSKALTEIENEMLEILAHIEADIDFSTENLQTLAESELARKLESLSHRVRELVRLAADGRKLKSAYRVVFIGPPNVGKSTLFNALCHEDVALVSPEAGTTRDVIKERCLIDGVEIEVADTAGIHETVQQLELLGIAKTQARADQSDILIFVMAPGVKLDRRIVNLFRLGKERGQKAIVVLNKSDLLDGISESEAIRGVQESLGDQMTADTQVFAVSGFDRVQTNLLLRDALRKIVATSDVSQAICFSDWQLDLLSSIQSNIDKGLAALKQGISSEFYAFDLREGLYSLQELLGKRFDDDILDRVFSRFCIGK